MTQPEHWNDKREEDIDTLPVELLRERLRAAEEVALVFGWCAVRRDESPRDQVVSDAWKRWYALVGTQDGGPHHNHNKRIDALVRAAEGRL